MLSIHIIQTIQLFLIMFGGLFTYQHTRHNYRLYNATRRAIASFSNSYAISLVNCQRVIALKLDNGFVFTPKSTDY
jgi:hypothetical protein